MALEQCPVCDKQIDLDVDVEHIKDHEKEVENEYNTMKREEILKPLRHHGSKYTGDVATGYLDAIDDAELILLEIYPDLYEN